MPYMTPDQRQSHRLPRQGADTWRAECYDCDWFDVAADEQAGLDRVHAHITRAHNTPPWPTRRIAQVKKVA